MTDDPEPENGRTVLKFINGRWYRYRQMSWYEGGRRQSRSVYLEPACGYVHPRRAPTRAISLSSIASSLVVPREHGRILSRRNRELLHMIAETDPASLQDLVDLTGRAKSNLSRTLKTMERVGLVRLERNGRTVVPRVVIPARAEM